MEIQKLLNDILNNCIPKCKLKKFTHLLTEYNFNPDDFTYIYQKKETSHKLPLDYLKERLFSEKKEQDIQIEDDNDLSIDNTLKQCDHYEKKIRQHEITGKKYYYYFGLYLYRIKIFMNIEGHSLKYINSFIEGRYTIKISTINKYIRFNKICDKYPKLLICDLTYKEIMNNIPELEKLLPLESTP